MSTPLHSWNEAYVRLGCLALAVWRDMHFPKSEVAGMSGTKRWEDVQEEARLFFRWVADD